MENRENIPRHVAIIMDGNGRWAKERNRPRVFGHQKGADRVREVVEQAGELGIHTLTLYAFSEENWKRPCQEVAALFKLLTMYLQKEVSRLHSNNVVLKTIGDVSKLPEQCQELLRGAKDLTKTNTGLNLVIALSYGGRSEITECCRKVSALVKQGHLLIEDINQNLISDLLFTAGLPDPDLIIRTSGEQRVSNFLLWQLAYAEFYFTPVLWPDFSRDEFGKAIDSFCNRHRRFGGIDENESSSALEFGNQCLIEM